jgi:hypothetical protein
MNELFIGAGIIILLLLCWGSFRAERVDDDELGEW